MATSQSIAIQSHQDQAELKLKIAGVHHLQKAAHANYCSSFINFQYSTSLIITVPTTSTVNVDVPLN